MKFFRLAPEVPGELGDSTDLDSTTHPPVVGHFHLDVTNWSGDDLVECFPCFAVTPALAAALHVAPMSGCALGPMETTINEDQVELYPDLRVPSFARLLVTGRAGVDDAGVDAEQSLVISDRFWRLLRAFRLEDCEVEEFRS